MGFALSQDRRAKWLGAGNPRLNSALPCLGPGTAGSGGNRQAGKKSKAGSTEEIKNQQGCGLKPMYVQGVMKNKGW